MRCLKYDIGGRKHGDGPVPASLNVEEVLNIIFLNMLKLPVLRVI